MHRWPRVISKPDVLFNLYVIGCERWAWMRQVQHPLYRNIMTNGLDLTPEEGPAWEELQPISVA